MKRIFFVVIVLLIAFALFSPCTVLAKDKLMVKNIKSIKVDTATATGLSEIIKSTLAEHLEVQSMDALAAVSTMVEEKMKLLARLTQVRSATLAKKFHR